MKKCEIHANAYGTATAAAIHHHRCSASAAPKIIHPASVPIVCTTRVATRLCARTYSGQNSPNVIGNPHSLALSLSERFDLPLQRRAPRCVQRLPPPLSPLPSAYSIAAQPTTTLHPSSTKKKGAPFFRSALLS